MYAARNQLADTRLTALDDARQGRSRTLLISGGPGLGKSRFLRQLVDDAQGFRVVSAHADVTDRGVPLATLRLAFAPMIDARRAIARPTTEMLREAFALGWSRDKGSRSRSRDLFRAAVIALSQTSPLLIAIDDLHAADTQSTAVLIHLMRQIRDRRVLVAVGSRSLPELGAATSATLDRFASHGDIDKVVLGPLPLDEVASMIHDLYRADPVDRLVSKTMRWTGGNPSLVATFLEAARRSDAVTATGGRVDLVPGASITLSPEQQWAVLEEVRLLDDDEQRLLSVWSAAGAILLDHLPQMARLAQLPIGRAEVAFDGLVDRGVLVGRDERFTFARTIVRAALYEQIGPARRRRLHSAASALPVEPGAETILHDESHDDADRLRLCESLARTHRHREAADLAVELTRIGLTPTVRTQACELGVREFGSIGLYEESAKIVDDLLAQPATSSASLLLLRSEIALDQERPAEARVHLDAADQLGALDSRSRTIRMRERIAAGEFHEAGAIGAALERDLPTFGESERSSAVAAIAMAAAFEGDPRQAISGLGPLGADPAPLDGGWPTAAWAHYRMGSWEAAEQLAAAVVAGAERDDTAPHPVAVAALIAIRTERGDFHGAETMARDTPDTLSGRGVICWATSLLSLSRGQDATALRILRRGTEAARASGQLDWLPMALGTEGHAALRAGDTATARRVCAELADLARDRNSVAATMTALLTRARVFDDADAAGMAQAHAATFGLTIDAATAAALLGAICNDGTLLVAAHRELGERGAIVRQREVTRHLRRLGRRVPGLRTAGAQLTAAEMEIASMVGLGMTNRQIASESSLSVKTVETYMTRIFVKTGCTSRTELAIMVSNRSVLTGP